MHHLFFAVVCLLWGSNFIMMNRAGLALGPVDIAFWRLLGGGLVMLAWWKLSGHQHIQRHHWPRLAAVALVGDAIPFAIQPFLVARGFGHSYFGMTVAFVPLLTLAVSIPMLRVWPTRNQLIGVVGGLLAIITLLWEGHTRGMSATTLGLAITIPTAYACCNTYIKWKLADVPAIPLGAALTLIGALYLSPLVLVPGWSESLGIHSPVTPERWPTALAALAWMAFIGTGISMVLFFVLLRARGPLFAGMACYPVPLVAMAWGVYDGEPITLRQILAITVVLSMVALVQTDTSRAERRGMHSMTEPLEGEPVDKTGPRELGKQERKSSQLATTAELSR